MSVSFKERQDSIFEASNARRFTTFHELQCFECPFQLGRTVFEMNLNENHD